MFWMNGTLKMNRGFPRTKFAIVLRKSTALKLDSIVYRRSHTWSVCSITLLLLIFASLNFRDFRDFQKSRN